ncbi:cation transporter [Streptomyces sp. NPDC007808]|uniref:cation transporter n=1 Tax=Streptomyces sp. NPDC007808 TaxID=3364779 RepID=UPI0036ABA357
MASETPGISTPLGPSPAASPAASPSPSPSAAPARRAPLARRDALARRIRLLVAATLTYNIVEAIVAITAGTIASSTALIGFGLDSVIEVSSAAAVAWQFSARDHAVREAREKTTLRIIAFSFLTLAAYVTVDAARALTGTAEAERSVPGIVLAALSLAVMPFLSAAQRRAGRELGSASAVADSKQTLLCTYLSAVLLAGLVLNATLGWTWADPVAALVIAAIAVKEGRDAWRGEGCCAPAAPSATPSADTGTDACGCRPGCDCCAQ